jgi:hypothetical protein
LQQEPERAAEHKKMGSLAKKVAATVLAAHFDEELCSLVRCAKSIFSFEARQAA